MSAIEWNQKQLPLGNPAEGHYILHYNLQRISYTDSSATVTKRYFKWFVIFLSLVVFLSSLIIFGWWGICVVLVVVPLLLMDWCRPTNLELREDGFRIHWLHSTLAIASPWLSWSSVSSVKYTQATKEDLGFHREIANDKFVPGNFIDIGLNTSNLSSNQKFLFEALCIPITHHVDDGSILTLRFLESAFFLESDQAILRSMLIRKIDLQLISGQLIMREEFGEVPTYTALWFASLSNAADAELQALPVGTRLAEGRYEVLGRLGSGGQSVVYDALRHTNSADFPESTENAHVTTDACVLKEFVLPVRGGIELKKRSVENIHREANLLKSINHPRIVKFQDLFVEGPRAYMVMEKIEGQTLRQVIETRGPLGAKEVITIALQLCDLLEVLHNENPPIIHRDFTPENLMLTKDNNVKLIDFNVAYRLESSATKSVVGKQAYVPPEQFRGKPVAKSDVYAMGCTLFFLLTGDDPEPISSSTPHHSGSGIERRLAEIVAHSTEPNCEVRLGLDEVQQQLRQTLQNAT